MAAYRRVYDSCHLPRTGISSGTLRSVIEYGLPLPFFMHHCVSFVGTEYVNSECDILTFFVLDDVVMSANDE